MKIIQSVCKAPLSQMTMLERIVNFVKEQAEADYDDAFDPGDVSESDFDGGMGGSDEGDPLFEEAKALVIETQKASAR